jgi:hypothetical protein
MYNETSMSAPSISRQFGPPKGRFLVRPEGRIEKEQRLRRLTRLVIGLCFVLLVYIIGRAAIPAPAPGGLDGCLRSTTAAPLPGAVKVGDRATITGPDGCFYFTALPAGSTTLRVELPEGVWEQPVTISPGQATSLGNLAIDLSMVTK